MVPTLYGRIQTRIVLTIVVGGLWTLIITPFLPTGEPLGPSYRMTFIILLTVLVLGIGWEFVYHGLQQFRWEKDWPTFFGLLTGINEGLLVWVLIKAGAIPGTRATRCAPGMTSARMSSKVTFTRTGLPGSAIVRRRSARDR